MTSQALGCVVAGNRQKLPPVDAIALIAPLECLSEYTDNFFH